MDLNTSSSPFLYRARSFDTLDIPEFSVPKLKRPVACWNVVHLKPSIGIRNRHVWMILNGNACTLPCDYAAIDGKRECLRRQQLPIKHFLCETARLRATGLTSTIVCANQGTSLEIPMAQACSQV